MKKKMNYNLKAFFSKLLSAKFQTAKVKGSENEVEYSANEVGVEVYVAGGEGSTSALDGTYELENGDSFVVSDGKISEVLSTFSDEDEEKVDIIIEEVEEEKEKHSRKKKMSAEDDEEALKNPITLSDEEVQTIVEQLAEAIKEEVIAEVVEAVKDENEEFKKKFLKSLKTTKANFSAVKTEEKLDKWAAFARASKIKNK